MNTEFKAGEIVVIKDSKMNKQRGFPPGAKLKIIGVRLDVVRIYVWVYWKDDPNQDDPLCTLVEPEDITHVEDN